MCDRYPPGALEIHTSPGLPSSSVALDKCVPRSASRSGIVSRSRGAEVYDKNARGAPEDWIRKSRLDTRSLRRGAA